MRKILLILLVAMPQLLSAAPLRVSLVTCWPGPEVYELYGHTALRIQGTDDQGLPFDSIWNYGVFSYSQPNFIGRFVKGEMLYQIGATQSPWFFHEYQMSGRRIEEQVLRLDSAQARRLYSDLQTNMLPQNREYLYDYVKDNCSTRAYDRIEEAAGQVNLGEEVRYPTFRSAMRAYHNHYPWYGLGIDVALAYPVDTAINARDQLFLPLMLHDMIAKATLTDGKPLVEQTNVLFPGLPDATLPPTPWYATPLFWGWVLLLLTLIYCRMSLKRGNALNWLEAIYFGMIGLAGCVVVYLVFFSVHKAASPNLLVMWLNPLALLVPVLIWSRTTRPIALAYMVAQSILLVVGSIVWPFQTQCGNPAFIPLILTDLVLTVTYVGIYLKTRKQD